MCVYIFAFQTFWNFGILSHTRAWSFLSGSKDLLLDEVSLLPPASEEAKEEEFTDEDLFAIGQRSRETHQD